MFREFAVNVSYEAIQSIECKCVLEQSCRLAHLSVSLSVRVYCGKTADWIWMLFGLVSGVGQAIGVLDGGSHPLRGREGFRVFAPSV